MSRLPLMLKSEEGPILRIYAFEPGRIAITQEMHDGMKVEARLDVAGSRVASGVERRAAQPMEDVTKAVERRARDHAARLCEALRARGDPLSLDAAAEIEGTLVAFAGLVEAQRDLRERAHSAARSLRDMHDLWSRVPQQQRISIAHDRRP